MKKNNIISLSILVAAAIPALLNAESHLYNVHAINATIETFDDQSKEHNNYQELEQLCGSLKQQNQRQTMQLEDTRTELTLMQARLEQQAQENNNVRDLHATSQAELVTQLAALKEEKNSTVKQLAHAMQTAKKQQTTIAKLENELNAVHDEKEKLEMTHAKLNQELLCAHQEIQNHGVILQEYNQLKQQIAQARTDLQFPDAKKIETLKQSNILLTKNN